MLFYIDSPHCGMWVATSISQKQVTGMHIYVHVFCLSRVIYSSLDSLNSHFADISENKAGLSSNREPPIPSVNCTSLLLKTKCHLFQFAHVLPRLSC
jgi:hypothetical protein